MESAIWLLLSLPLWYFSTLLAPFSAGVLSAIPAMGTASLLVGAVWGLMDRRSGLLLFLILPAASQALVAVSGSMRGSFGRDDDLTFLLVFVVLQLLAATYLVFRLKGARAPATALAVFSSSYALFAAFIAGMAFTDTWL